MKVPAKYWHKSRLCKLFGHKITGYRDGTPYLKDVGGGAVDNLGTRHTPLQGRCDHCDESILVAYLHVKEAPAMLAQREKQP